MKYLLALTVLASMSGAFANEQYLNCWLTAQGGNNPAVFVLKVNERETYSYLTIAYPVESPFGYERHGDCIAETRGKNDFNTPRFCLTQGQRINGLVPIDAEFNGYEYSVYCDPKIKDYF